MDAQLLYDGSRPTLLHPHHQDVREPPRDLRKIKTIAELTLPVLQRLNSLQVSQIEDIFV